MMKEEYLLSLLSEKNQMVCVMDTNQYTQRFGLMLSEQEAELLVKEQTEVLKEQQRIEFGKGVLEKLSFAFCDSNFISQDNYAETIQRLQEIFYLYKNESMDELTDDELIEFMREAFDGKCQGSLDYLEDTCLEEFAREFRSNTHRFIGRYKVDE